MVMDCPGYSKEFDPTQIFKKILVPIDFSPESRRALITACETRKRFESEIHVFVCTHHDDGSALRGLGVMFGRDDEVADAERCLGYLGDSICNGLPCVANNATYGEDVVKGVVQAANDSGATIVIMGLHQKHKLFRTRAEKIMQSLDIPVLLLQGDMEEHIVPGVDAEVKA